MAFLGGYELQRMGLGDVVVDARGAAFLATVPTELQVLTAMANNIGPAPFFMTKSYGDSWDPWFDRWRDVYDRGISVLPAIGEARTKFISEMNDLNKLSMQVRNGSIGVDLLVAALTGNPLAVLRYTIGNDPAAVARDVADAAGQVYDPGTSWIGWLWAKKWWVLGGVAGLAVAGGAVGRRIVR